MTKRSLQERVLQTICFEAIGIACVTPLYVAFFGGHSTEGLALFVAMSGVVMLWAPLFGMVFDWVEWQGTNRLASDRPHAIRLLHAVLYEVTSVAMTLPLAMSLGGLSFTQALGLNLVLTLFYIVYAYGFFWAYDRIRPVSVAQNAWTTSDLALGNST